MKKCLIFLTALALLLSLLPALVGCMAVEFSVNFVVDGEIYDTVTTSGKEIIRIPKSPVKNGYTFGGWYLDDGTWQKPFIANSLLDKPLSADMSVYAKWVEIHNHVPSAWITDTEATCTIVGTKHIECTACGKTLETGTIPTNNKHSPSEWKTDAEATCTIVGAKHIECTACGETLETGTIPTNDKHSPSEWLTDTEPTCTMVGAKHIECTACGKTLETETIPTNDKHSPSEWKTDTEATCTITGTKHIECTACGEVLETGTIPTNDKHSPSEWKTDTEATCTIVGTKHIECTACGETLETGTIPTNDKHSPSDWKIDTEATCTIVGTKHIECTACGETLETGTIPTNDKHSPSEWMTDTEATCTILGAKHIECTSCGEILETGTIPTNDKHSPSEWKTDTEPTCTIVGAKHIECTACGKVLETGTIPTNDKHSPSEWKIDTEPTCSIVGTKHIECTACGETLETGTIPTNDKHSPSEWKTDTEPTCTITGAKHIECTACGVVLETGTIPTNDKHSPSEWKIDTKATCTITGTKHKECTACGETLETGTIPTNDKHSPSEWKTDTEATCTITGTKHIECTACGETLETGTIPTNDKHSPSEWKTDTEATCTIIGAKHIECTACGVVLETGTIPTNDKHSPSEWKTDTEATCTITGTKHIECTACGKTLETGTIPTNDKHTPVTDKAEEATDTHDGLTEGSHCSACGVVLVKQNIIPAKLQGTDIKSVSLTVNGDIITGVVPNATDSFSFLDDIIVYSKAQYILSRDIDCEFPIDGKATALLSGDNIFYILVTCGEETKLYTVTIRRLPMYTVSFETSNGSSVDDQIIEEGGFATAPTATRAGYTFIGWDYDFTKPITADTTINALWNANTDTKYIVEYYLENVAKDGYDKTVKEFTGTTGNTATITPDTIAHFTFDAEASTPSGTIDGEGTLVLKIYYSRNTYDVTATVNKSNGGSVANSGSYAYEEEITLSAKVNSGYIFLGYFIGESKVSEDLKYTFKVLDNIDIVVKFEENTHITGVTTKFDQQSISKAPAYNSSAKYTAHTDDFGRVYWTVSAPDATALPAGGSAYWHALSGVSGIYLDNTDYIVFDIDIKPGEHTFSKFYYNIRYQNSGGANSDSNEDFYYVIEDGKIGIETEGKTRYMAEYSGEWAHLTVIYDFSATSYTGWCAYVYVDGIFLSKMDVAFKAGTTKLNDLRFQIQPATDADATTSFANWSVKVFDTTYEGDLAGKLATDEFTLAEIPDLTYCLDNVITVTVPPCEECQDEDGDYQCDNCHNQLSCGSCEGNSKDYDGHCDTCGADICPGEDDCVDLNNDTFCDKCNAWIENGILLPEVGL